jgi:outer membrane protein OmpA-like peptidoglycan-associated protein
MVLSLLVATMLTDVVDVSITRSPYRKGEMPSVNITILEPIAGFRLQLQRSDGKKVDVKGGGKPGQKRVIELVQPEGAFTWSGELSINYTNGQSGVMPLEFDTAVWGQLQVKTKKEDVDLANRKWPFTTNRPVKKAKLEVLMDTGRYAFNDEIALEPSKAGEPITVTWPEAPGKVMMMWLKVYDDSGHFAGAEFWDWWIDIPHDDIEFETGKSDIRESEAQKLEKSYKDINAELVKYAQIPDLELSIYIIGHTDSVGPKDYNRTLSLSRAKSIAAFLRKRGLKAKFFYEGFGEESPKVARPDETDEPQNRRAQYILSIGPPRISGTPWDPKWQKL